jgi:PEP-CTERM motif
MKFPLLAFAAVLMVPGRADGGLIGTFGASSGLGRVNPAPQMLSLRFAITPTLVSCFNLGECVEMFSINGLTESSAGTTVYFGPLDPNFATVSALFTDGSPHWISIAGDLADSVPALPGGGILYGPPDFVGSTIGLIAVRIDSVSFSTETFPGSTMANYSFTISVYDAAGEIPEPSSAGLVAIGCLAAIAWRIARR